MQVVLQVQSSPPQVRTARALRIQTWTVRLCAAVALALVVSSAILAKRGSVAPPLAQLSEQAPTATDTQQHTVLRPGPEPTPEGIRIPIMANTPEPAAAAPSEERAVSEDHGIVTPPAGFERYVNGRPVRRVRTIWMTVTGYSPDHRSCGKFADGITASGKSVWTNGMRMVAADTSLLPMGTLLSVPGYAEGEVVPVLDRGSAIKGARLDVLYPSHGEAREWGVRHLPVTIWEYAD